GRARAAGRAGPDRPGAARAADREDVVVVGRRDALEGHGGRRNRTASGRRQRRPARGARGAARDRADDDLPVRAAARDQAPARAPKTSDGPWPSTELSGVVARPGGVTFVQTAVPAVFEPQPAEQAQIAAAPPAVPTA